MTRIDADLLICGQGDPVTDGCVVLDGARIAYAGPAATAPEERRNQPPPPLRVPVLMPGLWDCHGHFLGERHAGLDAMTHTHVATCAARATADARLALEAGFTTVREVGGIGVHLAHVIDEGTIPGPTIYASGSILSPTGGHGDLHSYRPAWVEALCHENRGIWICDGVPDCLKAVRSQLRLGARVIKVCASGGVVSELDHPLHQQFSDEELAVIVEEAGRAERVVAAHCHGKAGILAALRAGVRTIEHGSYLDEECVAALLETGTVLVPTRFVFEALLAAGPELAPAVGGAGAAADTAMSRQAKSRQPSLVPDYAFAKMQAIADRHAESLELACRAGVRIALGTDIFTSGAGSPAPWGRNGEEFALLAAAGLSPLGAVEAATANGPLTLGPQAPRSGVLAAGYDADLIAVASDPLADLTVLADPANVIGVWKGGTLVKDSLRAAR